MVYTCTCVHLTCHRCGVAGDRYGVSGSYPWCHLCHSLQMTKKKHVPSQPSKAKTRHTSTADGGTRISSSHLPPAEVTSSGSSKGLPGVIVNEDSGSCTFALKGGKTCSCQRYSKDNPRDPRNPGCRECTHGHSVHNGRRPASDSDAVHTVVRNILSGSQLGPSSHAQHIVPFKAAQDESISGYHVKDKVCYNY